MHFDWTFNFNDFHRICSYFYSPLLKTSFTLTAHNILKGKKNPDSSTFYVNTDNWRTEVKDYDEEITKLCDNVKKGKCLVVKYS